MSSSAHDIEAEILLQLTASEETRRAVGEEVRKIANQACDFAKGIAPVLKDPDGRQEPGAYRDSIHVEKHADVAGLPAARVISRDKKAHWIEFGTKPGPRHGATPEFAVFGKTAQHFGGTLAEGIGIAPSEFEAGGAVQL